MMKINMDKSISKFLIGFILLLQFVIIVVLIVTVLNSDKLTRKKIVEFTDTDGHIITVNQIGSPVPLGDTDIEIVVTEIDGNQYIKRTYFNARIANDSKALNSSQFFVKWLEDGAELSVQAEEQPDCTYTILWKNVFQEDFPILQSRMICDYT